MAVYGEEKSLKTISFLGQTSKRKKHRKINSRTTLQLFYVKSDLKKLPML